MQLNDFIRQAEARHNTLKNSVVQINVKHDDKTIRFNKAYLHPEMDFSNFNNDTITLYHAYVHTVFANDKSKKETLSAIHNKIEKEMENRKIQHFPIDKLDVTTKV